MESLAKDPVVSVTQAGAVPAAKMHILGLLPLKEKLGPKWERLSGLVHKLFKRAIAQTQGPSDHFIVLDELSYAVTFANLSLSETRLACNAIAREVCELLFGDQVDEVSVRTMVAKIVLPKGVDEARAGILIDDMLEKAGIETVVTQTPQVGTHQPVISVRERGAGAFSSPLEQIQAAHTALAQVGLGLGFFPIWELRNGTSNLLFLAPTAAKAPNSAPGRLTLAGMPEARMLELEIELLNSACAYATRIHAAGKVCAVCVGVSYNTLSSFHARIRYITALQKTHFSPASPLVLKMEQVPEGAPDARIGEMITMLRRDNVRAIVEFRSLSALPAFEIRLGASGFGGTLPAGTDGATALRIAEKLAQRAAAQKANAFLDHIDTTELLVAANQANVRLGTGATLSSRHFTGLEEIPHFPLSLAAP